MADKHDITRRLIVAHLTGQVDEAVELAKQLVENYANDQFDGLALLYARPKPTWRHPSVWLH